MTRLLVKKQLREIFRSYFYDAKRNKKRSKAGVIAYFVFFVVIMAGVLGGIFTMLANLICEPLSSAGLGWLYYIIMGVMAVLLGVFGSVFNTYSALYMAKDNDLLLSLPIPVNAIMISRLLTVYLMGLMYSACILIPTMIVYWIQTGASFSKVIGALILLLDISLIDLVLSCLFGYLIARISLKLKNKGIITALIAVVFIGVYYFFSFRFNDLLNILLQNAEQYSERIEGSAWLLYLFGTIGEGKVSGMLIWTVICVGALAVTWYVLHRSFLKIATSTGASKKIEYKEKAVRQKSPDAALLSRELKRFTGSANYMLNCGLGIVVLPVAGVLLLLYSNTIMDTLTGVFGYDIVVIAFSIVMSLAGCMINPVAPAVSLEGKSIWIVQSLPVDTWKVLKAKLRMQLLLSLIPLLFTVICGTIVLVRHPEAEPLKIIMFIALPILFQVFMALWGLFWGVRKANINWSSEIYPIKQSMPIILSLFGGWGMAVAIGGLYLLFMNRISLTAYMAIAIVAVLAVSAILFRWLKKKGTKLFNELR